MKLYIFILLVGMFSLMGCGESYIWLSRGSRTPPELRELNYQDIERYYTQEFESKRFAAVGTYIDFGYIRALLKSGKITKEQSKVGFQNYIKKQSTFYVYLYILDNGQCPVDVMKNLASGPMIEKVSKNEEDLMEEDIDENNSKLYDISQWNFSLAFSNNSKSEPYKIVPVAYRNVREGGCVISGYVHFPVSIKKNVNWMALSISSPVDDYSTILRWNVKVYSKGRPTKEQTDERASQSSESSEQPSSQTEIKQAPAEPASTEKTDEQSPEEILFNSQRNKF